MHRDSRSAAALAVALGLAASALHAGPDVIVGDLPGTAHWGPSGGVHAYAVATTSCNVGDQILTWQQSTTNHPVIAQNLYRLSAAGRFEQIGQSWLKHGFCALQQTICGSCSPAGQGCPSALGIGCSDPYGASLNGTQSGLGPRFEVDPVTGSFQYPFTSPSYSGILPRRIQVTETDLVFPGALYFVEGQYIHPEDAMAGNGNNNASYRRVTIGSNFLMTTRGSTQRELPAIYAWRDHGLGVDTPDPDVQIQTIDIPDDGRFILAHKVTDNGNGTWHYEYALHNLNSKRAASGFGLPKHPSVVITGTGFHDVDYHSGEPFAPTNWQISETSTGIAFDSPQTFAENPDTNALRWGTMYNFRFDANTPPVAGQATLDIFEPGTTNSVMVDVLVPNILGAVPVNISEITSPPTSLQSGFAGDFLVRINEGDDQVIPGSTFLNHRTGPGAFTQIPLVDMGGDTYMASIPSGLCGDTPEFYVSADGPESGTITLPPAGASAPYSLAIEGLGDPVVTIDAVEASTGWVVGQESDTATTGIWEHGDPIGNDAQPEDDHSPVGVNCWFTGNGTVGGPVGEADIDGGNTTLISPLYDLSGKEAVTISYWRWFSNTTGAAPAEDIMTVEISDDGGETWEPVETVGPITDASGGWIEHAFDPTPMIDLTSTVQLRFVAGDTGAGSVVEAAIDDITISEDPCIDPSSIELRFVAAGSLDEGPISVAAGETVNLYVQARLSGLDSTATGITTFDGSLTDDGTGGFSAAPISLFELDPGLPDTPSGEDGMFPPYRATIGGNNGDAGNGQQVGNEWLILPLNIAALGSGEGLAGEWSNVYKTTWTTADVSERTTVLSIDASLGGYQSTGGLRQPVPIISDTIDLLIGTADCPCDTDGTPGVDVLDLLGFLELWFANDIVADFDGSTTVDVLDLLEFLSCWFPASSGATCP